MKTIRRFSSVAIFFCLLPVISVLVAMLTADQLGCTLNEGVVNSCESPIGDIGEALYIAFVMGWLALMTLPIGALIAALWIALELLNQLRRAS